MYKVTVDSTGVAKKIAPGVRAPETVLVYPAMESNARHYNKQSEYLAPTDVPLEDLPVVTISDRMYRLAELIAQARELTYQPIDGGKVYGEQQSVDANLTGVVGELAVQQWIGDVNQAIFIRGDPGYDVEYQDVTLDVKTTATEMKLPDLLIPHDQDLVAAVYLLAHRFEENKVRLVGWAPRHVVKARDPERHPGSSLNYVIRPEELRLQTH